MAIRVVKSGKVLVDDILANDEHTVVRTFLDVHGRKWVAMKDVYDLIGMPGPESISEDDVLKPIDIPGLGIRAGIQSSNLSVFFARVGYSGVWATELQSAIQHMWASWFSEDGQSIHPLHLAYTHVLNEIVEPAINAMLVSAKWDEPKLNALSIYDYVYPKLLESIGADQHIDMEDLCPAEITMLMSSMVAFSNLLLSHTVRIKLSNMPATGCKWLLDQVTAILTQLTCAYSESYDVNREIVEAKIPDIYAYREITYRDKSEIGL